MGYSYRKAAAGLTVVSRSEIESDESGEMTPIMRA
jgi:hypothetical protein